jgi:hypothetical protein
MTNSSGVPSLVDFNKSPNQDDVIVKLAKILQSSSIVGGPPDQNVIQNTEDTENTETDPNTGFGFRVIRVFRGCIA